MLWRVFLDYRTENPRVGGSNPPLGTIFLSCFQDTKGFPPNVLPFPKLASNHRATIASLYEMFSIAPA
jgi:hypothetical protein